MTWIADERSDADAPRRTDDPAGSAGPAWESAYQPLLLPDEPSDHSDMEAATRRSPCSMRGRAPSS
ncbi:hypothetical protein [Lysobacter sp. CA199]|uniref:hypothetical protein n=1 Tax=Lysobacter sp. CA199 TaxID=3455608 RepID=UPI003F8D4F97